MEIKTNSIRYNVDVSGCSPEVISAITQTLSKVKDDLQKVADINKEENKQKEESKKKETKKRWKPDIKERFYYIDPSLTVGVYHWGNFDWQNDEYKYRNVFKTEKEATFEAERRKIMAELRNYADEHNGKIAHPSDTFWLGLDEDDMSITIEFESYLPPVGAVLFSDEEIAYDAVKAIGEDRILKYMFGVNSDKKEVHCNGDCECCDEYDKWEEENED